MAYAGNSSQLTIKVKKSKKFYDNKPGIPTYTTRSRNRGKLLLINNITFRNAGTLTGGKKDETMLVKLFDQMGFGIDRHRDLGLKDMQEAIIDFVNDSSLEECDISMVIVMSHGDGDGSGKTKVLCSDGELLDTSWIVEQFDPDSCPYLSGKPKIFIFQCCRGPREHTRAMSSNPRPRQNSDVLIAYATVPGFVAYFTEGQGAWYIQFLCQVFMERTHDLDIETLLRIVDYELCDMGNDVKQTSSYESRGFKKSSWIIRR